MLILVCIL